MRSLRLPFLVCGALAIALLTTACSGDNDEPANTATPRPIPTPVAFAQEPQGAEQGDPAFEALPGATAHFGRLGGAIYQIEMPDDWNGRLVLYIHGSHIFEPMLFINQPFIRGYLIRNGFAWGASSFSSNVPNLSGLAADETAALWDFFVQDFGLPDRTYVTGISMGGGGTFISAERYPDRYDGGLGMCASSGFTATSADSAGIYFVAGAFVAGVNQADLDSTGHGEIIDNRILPALDDPGTYELFENIVIDLTGGPRPFDREGIRLDDFMWTVSKFVLAVEGFDNRETVYELGPASSVASEDFNRDVVRLAGDVLPEGAEGNDVTGGIKIPVLSMVTTGDIRVAMSVTQIIQGRVNAEGKSDLLVSRAVRDPRHCGFSNGEWETALEDLIAWVEKGEKPEGEDLLVDDLTDIGNEFTLTPRLGSPEADAVPGADERLTLRGTITLDGDPFDGQLFNVVVRRDGLSRSCSYDTVPVSNGSYEVLVAADAEAAGCGAPGARLFLNAGAGEQFYASQELADWPEDESELQFDASFSRTDPGGVGRFGTVFAGRVSDSSGETMPPGTVIRVYVGETLCGVSSLPRVVLGFSDAANYQIVVVGPEFLPDCAVGEEITFRVDRQLVEQTAVHDLVGQGLDLTVP